MNEPYGFQFGPVRLKIFHFHQIQRFKKLKNSYIILTGLKKLH